jgi:SAM-dependent methyltransferase
MHIAGSLRLLKRAVLRYLYRQIIVQLDHDNKILLANSLAPEIMLAMGIASPLASSHGSGVYQLTVEAFLEQHCKAMLALPDTCALDIGCGLVPRNPFMAEAIQGVDIRPQAEANVVRADLFNEDIPFADGCFDYVTAFDFIEHVPRAICEQRSTRFPFVRLMDEIWRVLKPGGLFLSCTPAFPSQQVFQDPTHVNAITENTFPLYFCEDGDHIPWARMYGYDSSFRLVSQGWSDFYLFTLIEKVDAMSRVWALN